MSETAEFNLFLTGTTPPIDENGDPVFIDERDVEAADQAELRVEIHCVDGRGHVMVYEAPDPEVGFPGVDYCERCGKAEFAGAP